MTPMRILHLYHGGLPYVRIERAALTMKKEGHEVVFLGGRLSERSDLKVFDHVHCLPIAKGFQIALDPRVKAKWIRRIREINPDIIHAHNIIAGSFVLDAGYPAVYDDHEYWSKNLAVFSTRGIIRSIANKPLMRMVPKWEHKLLERYPVITVSEAIAKEHRERASWVGVVHNYPYLFEVEHLVSPENRSGSVFVGWDFSIPKFKPYRDLTGLKDVLQFDILTGLPHDVLMERLTHYRIGLNAFRPHPWHKYSDANKTYEYLHAGLQVVTNKLIMKSLPDEPYVFAFDEYSDIKDVVDSIPDVDGNLVMDHARKRYVWDIQERVIREAYSRA